MNKYLEYKEKYNILKAGAFPIEARQIQKFMKIQLNKVYEVKYIISFKTD